METAYNSCILHYNAAQSKIEAHTASQSTVDCLVASHICQMSCQDYTTLDSSIEATCHADYDYALTKC